MPSKATMGANNLFLFSSPTTDWNTLTISRDSGNNSQFTLYNRNNYYINTDDSYLPVTIEEAKSYSITDSNEVEEGISRRSERKIRAKDCAS